MKIPLRTRPRSGDIDMVPMINFAFLLLIFFLLVGRIAPAEALRVEPPQALEPLDSGGAGEPALLMDAEGRLAWGSEAITADELASRAAAWAEVHPDAALSLKADAATDAARVILLLEQLRDAGVIRVRLQTIAPPG
ncbi:MAG: ExbD/TolR family protein [Panacagrimonas sp.]